MCATPASGAPEMSARTHAHRLMLAAVLGLWARGAVAASTGDAMWFEQLDAVKPAICGAQVPASGDAEDWHAARAAWDDALRDLFPRDPIPAAKSAALALAGLERVLTLSFCAQPGAEALAQVERGVADFIAHFPGERRTPEALFVRGVARLRAGLVDSGVSDLASVSRDAPSAAVAPRARLALADHFRLRDELYAAQTHFEAVRADAAVDAGARAYAAMRLRGLLIETRAPDADARADRLRGEAEGLLSGRDDAVARFIREALSAPPVSASPSRQ